MRKSTRERQDRITAGAYSTGEVFVRELVVELGVSEATIRRDLHQLEERGQLELVHGGAILPRRSDFSYRSKALRHVEAKRRIGELAGARVRDGDQIFLDSGTTCSEMIPHLKAKRGLNIIVNSARLALELDGLDVSVILLGGQYRPARMDTVGPLASAALDQLRGYDAFIGADGVDMEFGLTASDVESASIYRQAIQNARTVTVVADHSKFAESGLCRIVDWSPITRIITNRRPATQWVEFFNERHIELITG